jgi:hypothetical protein
VKEEQFFELGYIFCKLKQMCTNKAIVKSKDDVGIEDYFKSLYDILQSLGVTEQVKDIIDEINVLLCNYKVDEVLKEEDGIKIRKLLDELKYKLFRFRQYGDFSSVLNKMEKIFGGGGSDRCKNR